jgi:isochorismate synthase
LTTVTQPEPASSSTEPSALGLLAAIAGAVEVANARGAPVLVRVHQELPQVDPWRLLGHPALAGLHVLAWHDDAQDRCFLALESLRTLPVSGEARFDDADAAVRDLPCFELDLLGQPVPAGAPVACTGFRFADAPPEPGSAWDGWESGLVWFPHALLDRRGARTHLVVAEAVAPGADPATILAELERNRHRILAHVGEPRPARAAVPALSGPERGRDEAAHQAFVDRVERARDATRAGELAKVVLARSESWRAPSGTRFDPFGTAVALRERQGRCTTFALRRRDGSAFVGATPELLVRVEAGRVHSVALAGTARRESADAAARLLASDKDRHEQALVTAAVRSALAEVADEVEVPDVPEVIHLADVLHMETRISARLRPGHGLLAVAGRLHPTPAVGGLPHSEALAWMAAHEGLDRGWYAAPIGWVDAAGEGALMVALRCVLLRDERATTFAGCGIVPDSQPEAEWQETLSKLQAVSRGLAVEGAG